MEKEHLNHVGCKNKDTLKFKRYVHHESLIGIQCEKCLSEWVLEEYLPPNNQGEETLNIDDKKMQLMKKPNVDKRTFKLEPAVTEIKDISNLAEYLVPGDHIKYKWYLGLSHHAIVKEVTRDDITLIHWQGGDENVINPKVTAEVVQQNLYLDEFKKKVKVICRMDYRGGAVEEGTVQEDNKILTITRAKAWIGEKGYSLLKKNCEHFAVYCKIGNHWSFQTERLTKMIWAFVCESGREIGTNVGVESLGTMLETATSGITDVKFLRPQMQVIGLGLVVVIQGVALFVDLKETYKRRNDAAIEEEEFVGTFWSSIYTRIDKVFYTGVVPTAGVVTLGALLPETVILKGISILLGAICAGVLSIPWGYNGEVLLGGKMLSSCVRNVIRHEDVTVRNIKELHPGDHIVLYRWFLHPRCHMIVTGVDVSNDKITVIRFDYRRGVVEEKIPFYAPLHKVIRKRPYEPETVIQRAREKYLPPHAYNIFKFNCKHFAFWITTNTVPYEP